MQELDYGGVVIQLWRRNCTEIAGSRWRSYSYRHGIGATNAMSTTFALPSAAAWMTVTTNDTAKVEWTLT